MNTTRRLNLDVLGRIRTQLQERGIKRRLNTMPSFKYIDASHAVLAETMAVVEEYGPLCEVMYLMMAADHRVVQAEREVLRGALDLISEGKVRTAHMEAMLDAASRQLAAEGVDVRLAKVVRKLKRDPARAELSVALAAAVALADEKIVPEEQDLFMRLIRALGISEERANEILQQVEQSITTGA
jgi:tellurite resistance protein